MKADGADINYVPWNERIQLVLPWCRTRQLKTMERACMRRWRRQITRSLTAYLSTNYGQDWVAHFLGGRRAAKGLKRLGEARPSLSKRRKVDGAPLDRGVACASTSVGHDGAERNIQGLRELLVDAS